MKRFQGLVLLAGLLIGLRCYGDTVLSVQNQDLSLGATTTTVPLLLTGYQDASAIQFTVQWDASILSYSSLGSFNSSFLLLDGTNTDGYVYINTSQTSQGLLMVAYDNPLGSDFSVSDGATLFSISFDVVGNPGASSTLGFTDSPTARKLVSVNTGSLAFTTSDGTIHLEAPDPGQPPTIALNGDANVTHEAGVAYTDPGVTASDPEDGDLTSHVVVTGAVNVNQLGAQTLTYDVTDSFGNKATVDRVVIVVDTIAPVLVLNGNANITHEAEQVYLDAGATAVDSFEGNLAVVTSGSVNVSMLGAYTISYSATDSSQNNSSLTRKVTVVDSTGPDITLVGDAVVNHEAGNSFSDPGASAQDSHDGQVNVVVTGTVDSNLIGTYEITYDASDQAGNAAVATKRTIHVVDTTKPIINIIGETKLSVEAGEAFSNPGSTVDDFEQGLVPVITGGVNTSVLGVYELNYDVSDSSQNVADTVKVTVTVKDTVAPSIILNGNAFLTQEVGLPYQEAGAMAVDSFEGNIDVSISGVVDVNTLGQYTFTYTAKDSSNNESTATRSVSIVDTTAPTISLNGDVFLNHEAGTPFVDPGATASDNYDGGVSVVASGTVDTALLGSYEITYSATDKAGNASDPVKRTVQVIDTTAPEITLLGGTSVTLPFGQSFVEPGYEVSDNTSGASSSVIGNVNPFEPGQYELVYNAEDASNNKALSKTRTISVSDRGQSLSLSLPSLSLQVGTTSITVPVQVDGYAFVSGFKVNLQWDPGVLSFTSISDFGSNGAGQAQEGFGAGHFDLSQIANGSLNADYAHPTGANASLSNGSTLFSLTFGVAGVAGDVSDLIMTDQASVLSFTTTGGKSPTHSVSNGAVTLEIGESPVITLIGSQTSTHEAGTPYSDPGANGSDLEDGSVNVQTVGQIDVSVLGAQELVYTAKDSSGNFAQEVKRTVTIVDTTSPIIALNGDATLFHEVDTNYTDPGATALDSFDGNVPVNVSGVVNPASLSSYVLTYSAQDLSGNQAVPVNRTVTVRDTIAPVITLEGGTPMDWEAGTAFVEPGAKAVDSHDGALNYLVTGTVDVNALGQNTLAYDATDFSGNPAQSVARIVNVVDTIAPTITLTGGSNQMTHEAATPFTAHATATDSFDGTVQVQTTGQVNVNVLGSYQLTYDAVDRSGNQAIPVLRTVEVVDTTAPVITMEGSTSVIVLVGTSYSDAGATATDTLDTSINVEVEGSVNVNVTGLYTLTYRAKDASGNNALPLTRVVEVVDDVTPPEITLLGSASVSHEAGQNYNDAGATASDNRDGDLSSQIQVSGSVNEQQPGTYEIRYNVSDAAGNPASEKVRTVFVSDSISPILTLNGGGQLNHEAGVPFTDPGSSAQDNFDGDISSSIVVTGNVNTQLIGNYTLQYDVADNAGNDATSVTREVRVLDTLKPVLSLIGEASVSHEAATPYSDPGAEATDSFEGNLSGSITAQNTVNINKTGNYQITYNVADSSGNAADELKREVKIVDTVVPVITLLGETDITHEAGNPFSDPGATALDNIDGNLTDSIQIDGEVLGHVPGSYVLTYRVVDQSGNQAKAQTRKVLVVDTLPPTIRLIGAEQVIHLVGSAYSDEGAEVSDMVDGDVGVLTTGSVDSLRLGDYTLTYSAVDQAGNRSDVLTRTVTVSDGVAVGDLILTSTDLLENGDSVKAILFLKEPSLANIVPIIVESDIPDRVKVEGPNALVQGSERMEFIISAVNDSIVNHNQTVSLRIHNGYRDLASAQLKIIDDDIPETIRGTVADGLISNATVFFDVNGNQSLDAGEPSTTTNKSGEFHLSLPVGIYDQNGDGKVDSKDGFIVSLGGIDTATGVAIDYPLSAPPTATVVNPVTSIVTTVMKSNQNLDENAASSVVKNALGINSGIDVLNFDMFGEANKGNAESVEVIKLAAKLQDTIVQTSSLIQGSGGSGLDTSSISQTLAAKMINGEQINLDDSDSVGQLIDSAARSNNKLISVDHIQKAAYVIALQNELKETATNSAASITEAALEVSRIQSFSQSEIRSDLSALSDNKTTLEDLDVKYERQNVLGLVSSSAAGPLFGIDARAGTFQFSASNFEVKETGEIVSSIKVTRSEGNLGAVKVLVIPKGLTASAGEDFSEESITLTFEDQELFKQVDVGHWMLNDDLIESSETFEISLSLEDANATDARIGEHSSARGLILDDDTVGAFQFSTAQTSFDENSVSEPSIIVERIGGSRGQARVVVHAVELPGGAQLGEDFEFSATELNFPDGVLKRRLYFSVTDDSLLEPVENFRLEIKSAEGEFSGAGIGQTRSALIQIVSDEMNAPPTVSDIDDRVIEEGEILASVPFTVSDDFTNSTELMVIAQSSDSILLRSEDIVVLPGASSGEWLLSATPTKDRAGDTTITITVHDGQLESTTSFSLVVINVNDAPSFSQLPNEIMAIGEAVSVPFHITDVDNFSNEVFVSVQAERETDLTQDKVKFIGSGNAWQMILNENGSATGTGLYTLVVTDSGGAQSSQTFRVYFSDPGTIVEQPTLSFSIGANRTIILSWEGNFELYQSPNLNVDFVPVTGAQSPYIVNMGEAGFFILKGN